MRFPSQVNWRNDMLTKLIRGTLLTAALVAPALAQPTDTSTRSRTVEVETSGPAKVTVQVQSAPPAAPMEKPKPGALPPPVDPMAAALAGFAQAYAAAGEPRILVL